MFTINQYLPTLPDKLISIPLEFQLPFADFLSKQFTKLNSHHQYRIHYLGPRFMNTLALHKKYANQIASQQQQYQLNINHIIQSYSITQKMRNNNYYKPFIYYRAFEGMNPTLNLSSQYIFNSLFEAGNLDCVIKIKQNQFDLFLRIDSNTRGHINWYYFSVKNGSNQQRIKFNICNMSKLSSLYQNGLKPYVYSKKKFQYLNKYWQQNGENITYQRKQLRYKFLYDTFDVPNLSTLSFQYTFEYEGDEVYFAYCVPYTYSQLTRHIQQLPTNYTNIYTVGHTASGVSIPLVHITNKHSTKDKKIIVITGRVHPAQSNSSHLLHGFMQYLCSPTKEAEYLRAMNHYIIIPMVNPDGVILGNSRTSAMGKDLNREYLLPSNQLTPQTFYIKKLIENITNDWKIFLYIDFHGHSSKKNTFLYGPPFIINEPQYYKCRIYPRLIEKSNSSFRFYSCSFGIADSKRRTGRAVMFEQFKVPYAYTIESSIGFFYDYDKNS